MKRAYLVARREYVENLRTKTFWIGIAIFPIMMALSVLVPAWLSKTKDVRSYVVLDKSGWMLQAVEQRAAFPDLRRVLTEARRVQLKSGDLSQYPPVIRKMVALAADLNKKAFDALVETVVSALDPGVDSQDLRDQVTSIMGDKMAAFDAGVVQRREEIRSWWRSLKPEAARKLAPDLDRGRYRRVEPEDLGDHPQQRLGEMVDQGQIFAYFIISKDPVADGGDCRYVSNNQTDRSLRRWFTRLVNEEVRERRFLARGIDRGEYRKILAPVDFQDRMVAEGGQEKGVTTREKARQWVPLGFAWVLWIAVFSVAQMLLTNTVEEKSNRIIEVLLSSVSPLQLMSGKIAGIAITGLTILTSWIIFTFVGIKFGPGLLGHPLPLDLSFILRDPLLVTSFLVYFLLGYLFYAAFLVGLGSVCNSLKEAQNLMQPIMLVMIMPLLAILPIAQDPNGALARFLSYIPPFTPFVMMNRSAGPPSVFEYITTGALLVLSIVLAFWAAAKVFRVGILMTGKRPGLREILRWVRTPVGSVRASKTDR